MSENRLRASVGPIVRSSYNDTTRYYHNDIVRFDGLRYCHVGLEETVGVSPSDTDVWSRYIDGMLVEDYLDAAMTKAAKEGFGIRVVKVEKGGST